jgi:murein DD-endopeptidase MepM/ murein hydrolase activator NlpD
VQEGQRVEPGTMLGRVGHTTNGRFPGMVSHLHLELRRALPDGSSPFPGAYRRHNEDPEEWLADLGVRFDSDVESDCVVHEGDEDVPAPMLVVREIDPSEDVFASMPTAQL